MTHPLNAPETRTVLLLGQIHTPFASMLRSMLLSSSFKVFTSLHPPEELGKYSHCFCLDYKGDLEPPDNLTIVYITTNRKVFLKLIKTYASDIKICYLPPKLAKHAETAEKVIAFVLMSSGNVLDLAELEKNSNIEKQPAPDDVLGRILATSRLKFTFFATILLVVFTLLFWPPLVISAFLTYKQTTGVKTFTTVQWFATKTAKSLYKPARPIYVALGIAKTPDSLFRLTEGIFELENQKRILAKEFPKLLSQFSQSDKTEDELVQIQNSIGDIAAKAKTMQDLLRANEVDVQGLPILGNDSKQKLKIKLQNYTSALKTAEFFLKNLEPLMGRGDKKTLILFANSRELRPGGGFIGSFAVVKTKDYSLRETVFYDVYDADGQLQAHIDPPAPISKYLNQPHYFLRDSAFSPDFPQNADLAKYFLNKELGEENIDHVILVTTTALEQLLLALGPIDVPDFHETLTAENIYLKMQLHAEEGFFPGSSAKKRFIESVATQLMLKIETSPPEVVFLALEQILNEKLFAISSVDENFQAELDRAFWSGRMLLPQCSGSECLADVFTTIDANLGVNKANFFVDKSVSLDLSVDQNGTITTKAKITYENTGWPGVYPGGIYKNYLQIFLPPQAQISGVTINGLPQFSFDLQDGVFKTIGLYLEVPEKNLSTVEISYTLPQKIAKGSSYELILGKQLGVLFTPTTFSITSAASLPITKSNISPLVNTQKLEYNTLLTSDKVFSLQF